MIFWTYRLRTMLVCLLLLVGVACGQQNQSANSGAAQTGTTAVPDMPPTAVGAPEPTLAPVPTLVEETAAPDPSATEGSATTAATTAAVETTTTAGEETAAAGAGEFQNPVLRTNFPDPGIINVDGTYYAYATNGSGRNVQAARSTDLITWELLSDAMPALPKWAMLTSGFVWAPEVIQIGDTYVLYYTARDKEADLQCVGVATSDKPEGKFRDVNDKPFVCQTTQGGTIDASPFRDGDKLYLYYKNDGNCCGQRTYIYAQELAPDGLSLVGEPVELVHNDAPWEAHVIEAPTMWKQDDTYYLFYSANDYGGTEYAVGYATCESPVGPCQDAPENPILKSVLTKPPVIGPGHQTIILDDAGEQWLAYHAWEVSSAGTKTDRRFMWLDRLVWEDGKPRIDGPTTASQAVP